jgi:hypothetical protein
MSGECAQDVPSEDYVDPQYPEPLRPPRGFASGSSLRCVTEKKHKRGISHKTAIAVEVGRGEMQHDKK